MNRLEIPVNFTSYLHSGRGYMSLSFKNSTPRKEILDFLRGIEDVDEDRVSLRMRLGEVFFRGFIRSIISHKSHVTLTVHVNPSRFLVSRFYNLVGKVGLVFTISRPQEGNGHEKEGMAGDRPSRFLPREDYISLRNRVSENLKLLSGIIGKDVSSIIYEETTFIGKDRVKREGKKTLRGMKGTQLKYLDKRLKVLLKEARKGNDHYSIA